MVSAKNALTFYAKPLSLLLLATLYSAASACKSVRGGTQLREMEGEQAPENTPPPIPPSVPVIEVSADIPQELGKDFSQDLLGAMTSAFKNVAGTAAVRVATDSSNPNATPRTRFNFFRVLADMDQNVEGQIKDGKIADALRKLAPGQIGHITIEAMLISAGEQDKIPALRAAMNQDLDLYVPPDFQNELMKKLLWTASAADPSGKLADQTADVIVVSRRRVENGDGNKRPLFPSNSAFEYYMNLRIENPDLELPVYVAFDLTLKNQGISFTTRAMIKPTAIHQTNLPTEPGSPIIPRSVDYQPNIGTRSRNAPPVQRVTFTRTYGVEAQYHAPAKLVIEYGKMMPLTPEGTERLPTLDDPNRVTDFWICSTNCYKEKLSVPTVIMDVATDQIPYLSTAKDVAWGVLAFGANSKIPFFGSRFINELREGTKDTVRMYALVKRISIDLAAANGLQVIPEDTHVNIVVTRRNASRDRERVYDLTPTDSGYSTRQDWSFLTMPMGIVGGAFAPMLRDIPTYIPYSSMIREKVAGQVQPQVSGALGEANNKINTKFDQLFGKLVEEFKPQKP